MSWCDYRFDVWSDDGELVASLGGDINGAREMNENAVAFWGSEQPLRVWEFGKSRSCRPFCGLSDDVTDVQLLADNRLAGWDEVGTFCLWDYPSGRLVHRIAGQDRDFHGAIALPGGVFAAWREAVSDASEINEPVVVYSLETGERTSGPGPLTDWIEGIAAVDDLHVAWWNKNLICVWDAESSAVQRVLRRTRNTSIVFAGADGQTILLSAANSTSLEVIDGPSLTTKASVAETRKPTGCKLTDDEGLLTWCRTEPVHCWNLNAPQSDPRNLHGHDESIRDALSLGEGRIVAMAGHGGGLYFWSEDSDLATFLEGHSRKVLGGVMQNDQLITWSEGKTVTIWAMDSKEQMRRVPLSNAQWHFNFGDRVAQRRVGQFTVWTEVPWVVLGTVDGDMQLAWLGEAEGEAKALLPDGTVVHALPSGELAVLQARQGRERMSISEMSR